MWAPEERQGWRVAALKAELSGNEQEDGAGWCNQYVQNGCWLILIPGWGRLGESAGKECPDSSVSQFLFGWTAAPGGWGLWK